MGAITEGLLLGLAAQAPGVLFVWNKGNRHQSGSVKSIHVIDEDIQLTLLKLNLERFLIINGSIVLLQMTCLGVCELQERSCGSIR